MKRTTIMIDEVLLYELQQIANQQSKSTAHVLREALALYVAERMAPPSNPLLGLVGLGASTEVTNMANGRDEEILQQEIHVVYGWSALNDSAR